MNRKIVCNTLPLYQNAPVALDLFKESQEAIFQALKKYDGQKYMLIGKDTLELEIPKEIHKIVVKENSGFAFANESALIKVLEGEKPIPSQPNHKQQNQEFYVVSPEELLEGDTKRIYIKTNRSTQSYSVPKAISPRELLQFAGAAESGKGLYFGYPMGLFVGENMYDEKMDLITDYVEIIQKEDCILHALTRIMEGFYKESCGRCVYGYEGLAQIKMILNDITLKKSRLSDLDLLLELARVMEQQSLCEIGSTGATTVLTALESFREEITEHITKKTCRAGVCSKYVTYHILPDLCIGCGDCLDACEEDAILGKKKFIHVIDQDECTQCGKCRNVCEESAIVMAGADKPKGPKKPMPCK